MSWPIKPIRTNFYTFLRWYNFKSAKEKANGMHELTGKQYFVIPYGGFRFKVVDNNIKKIATQRAKLFGLKKQFTYLDLVKIAYYKTPVAGISR